jgi:hypothetical protein
MGRWECYRTANLYGNNGRYSNGCDKERPTGWVCAIILADDVIPFKKLPRNLASIRIRTARTARTLVNRLHVLKRI